MAIWEKDRDNGTLQCPCYHQYIFKNMPLTSLHIDLVQDTFIMEKKCLKPHSYNQTLKICF